jgi:hypothetical protein
MLPLTRGIYVDARTPCKGAPNLATLSYWGDDNGINDQQTRCKINTLEKHGSVYSLKRRCTSVRFGGSFDSQVEVTIVNPTAFRIQEPAPSSGEAPTYRYCGPQVQF